MTKIKIYSGLSANKSLIKNYLPSADCAPPIKRGDLFSDIRDGYHIIGIIDGEFYQNLAVSPSEILDLLRCGVQIYGSSSMGAMRAAELHHLGMKGVGRIYEHICKFPYFEDDLLGQLFFEGGTASMPFIDFQFAVENMIQTKKLGLHNGKKLMKLYRQQHFSNRSLDHLEDLVSGELKEALKSLRKVKTSQKETDAIELLKRIKKVEKDLLNLRQKHGFD